MMLLLLACQVRLLLERNREDLQRHLAVSEGQLGLMQEHLQEAQQEIEGLRQRVTLEQGRTTGACVIFGGGGTLTQQSMAVATATLYVCVCGGVLMHAAWH
jgi:hypothetical protein